MNLHDYCCSACSLAFPNEFAGGMYVADAAGEWVKCLHPGEFATAAQALGLTHTELAQGLKAQEARDIEASDSPHLPLSGRLAEVVGLLDTRLRFTKGVLCYDCMSLSEVPTGVHSQCPMCASVQVFTTAQSLGKSCPRCHAGTIEQRDTGIRF